MLGGGENIAGVMQSCFNWFSEIITEDVNWDSLKVLYTNDCNLYSLTSLWANSSSDTLKK